MTSEDSLDRRAKELGDRLLDLALVDPAVLSDELAAVFVQDIQHALDSVDALVSALGEAPGDRAVRARFLAHACRLQSRAAEIERHIQPRGPG